MKISHARSINLLQNLFIMKKLSSLILAFLFIVPAVFAQVDYITVKDYMTLIKTDKNVVTINADKEKDYQTSHITGSILFSYKDTDKAGDVKGLLKDPAEMATMLGSAGISHTNTIVVYDGGTQKYSTRMYWILKYLGAPNVLLLHKDLDAWRQARVPLTAAVTTLPATTFELNVNPSLLATTDLVKTAVNNPQIVLIDARTSAEYDGSDGKSNGHIPAAININFEDFLNANGGFKTKEEIMAITEKAGVSSNKEVILYCQTSIRGAVSFYVFKNILGFENVKLYDGAVEEWQVNNTLTK